MAWILLLIQVLPSVLSLIQAIRELISKQPVSQRPAAWKRLRLIAKAHVKKQRGGVYTLSASEDDVFGDLEGLRDDLVLKTDA